MVINHFPLLKNKIIKKKKYEKYFDSIESNDNSFSHNQKKQKENSKKNKSEENLNSLRIYNNKQYQGFLNTQSLKDIIEKSFEFLSNEKLNNTRLIRKL